MMRTPPEVLGGYQIQQQITTGGIVTTFLAHAGVGTGDVSFGPGSAPGRRVALHVATLSTDPTVADRQEEVVRRHAAAVSTIDHPAIAPIIDVGRHRDLIFVATAWIDAMPLDELLDRRWRLPVDEMLRLFTDVAAVLDMLHARGVSHLALSPSTIWVERTEDGIGSAFLTGFGNAALIAERLRPGGGSDASLVDAALYVAPEQLRDARVDGRADQYALACAMYHCVAGQPPFVRDTLPALFGAHLFARPAPPSDRLPGRLREILTVGLAKRPDDRYPSCSHLTRAARPPADPVPTPTDATVPSGERDAVIIPGDIAPRPSPRGAAAWFDSARDPVWMVGALVVFISVLGVLVVTRTLSDGAASGAVLSSGSSAAPEAVDLAAVDEPDAAVEEPDAAVSETSDVVWRSRVRGGGARTVLQAEGSVVAATSGGLYGLDATTGEQRWQHAVTSDDLDDAMSVDAAVVYRSAGQLAARDARTGEQLWSVPDTFEPNAKLSSGPGAVYGIGPGVPDPEIVALDPATGDERWHYHGDLAANAGIAANADLVVVAQDRRLTALDPRNRPTTSVAGRPLIERVRWTADVPDLRESSVLLTDSVVLFVTSDGQLCAHAAQDGERAWCTPVRGADTGRPVVVHAEGVAVVVTPSDVTAIDVDAGAQRWHVRTTTPLGRAVTVTGDTVAVSGDEGTVRGLALTDGTERWSADAGRRVVALAADDDGVVAGTRSGGVARLAPSVGGR